MRVLILLLLVGCTRYAATPPPAPPAAAKISNRAAAPCSLIVQHVSEEAKCSLWSGRETALPDEVDAVLCLLPNGLLYCDAPDNGKPELQVVADWSAPVPKVEAPVEKPAEPVKPAKKR